MTVHHVSTSVPVIVDHEELKIIADMVASITKAKLDKGEHLCVENFAGSLFGRILYEVSCHKQGLIRESYITNDG